MNLQQLLSYSRRACEDYSMINAGDHIVAAVSGGKDSLAMLASLAAMRRFYPKPFTLSAVTVHPGFDNFDLSSVSHYCDSINVPYTVLQTDIGNVVFNERAEKNPCSLCAKMRKGALNDEALRIGATRVAYGHNKDDIIHTFFMSLFLEGRLHTPAPVTFLSRTGLYAIRPIFLVPESDIIGFVKSEKLPVVKSPCPADGNTAREEMKPFIAELRKKYSNVETKIFNALQRGLMEPGKERAMSE
jgi:tRNA(Ile)-lysidine synthase TilS/MesJ